MMIDAALEMSLNQVLTATGNSANYLDYKGPVNLAAGRIPRLILNVSAVSGTTPTLDAVLVGADDAAFSVNKVNIGKNPTQIVASGLYRIPIANVARKQFYRLEYAVGGTTPSFTVSTEFVMDDEARQTP